MAARTKERTLDRAAARAFYDRFGSRQDDQGWYEDAAIERLVARGGFGEASSVLELGCGTGRVAEMLLERHLPEGAGYLGFDVSATMLGLARARLDRFGARAAVELHAASGFPQPGRRFDRLLSTYVLDLLPEREIAAFPAWAETVLSPRGRVCLAGITRGSGPLSKLVMGGWSAIFRLRPSWVGGCRPVEVAPRFDPDRWTLVERATVVRRGIASEVVVASLGPPGAAR